ncbi:MAG TPA: hypothetical protein VFZ53_27120 [Polyangiaceae bacterium]
MACARFVLFALFALSVPLTASAQTSPDALSRNTEAVTRGEQGLEAFRNGDWAAAYDLFQQAETLAHSPVFLLYMARARERQGASAEALDLYDRVARSDAGNLDSWRSAVEQARREGAELRAKRAEEAEPAAPVTSDAARNATHSDGWPRAAVAAGVTGVAGLALGAAAGIVAWVELDELKSRCKPTGCDPADQEKLDRIETWTRLSNVGFVVGGVGLATAGIFLWVVPAETTARGALVDAGLGARVRF